MRKLQSLSRVAEGIGPKTPGNLEPANAVQPKVLNPTEVFLKDEGFRFKFMNCASLSKESFFYVSRFPKFTKFKEFAYTKGGQNEKIIYIRVRN